MKLIDEMVEEHELIEALLGSLRTYVGRRVEAGTAVEHEQLEQAAGFERFFRLYAGDFHHAREEQVLFPALVKEAELPGDKGPILAIENQHEAMAKTRVSLFGLLTAPFDGEAAAAEASRLAIDFSHALWRHIDAENSVLFPEAAERLLRVGVPELDGPSMSADEEAAMKEGQALLELYPPLDDQEAVRGDGCVVCPSFGIDCLGIERSWWADSEWDELHDRVSH